MAIVHFEAEFIDTHISHPVAADHNAIQEGSSLLIEVALDVAVLLIP